MGVDGAAAVSRWESTANLFSTFVLSASKDTGTLYHVMNNFSATTLARAATLAGNLENLNTKLTEARATVDALSAEIAPIQSEYNTLLGVSPKAATRPDGSSGRFTDEQRAAISAGLKASWERRKAARAFADLTAVANLAAVANSEA